MLQLFPWPQRGGGGGCNSLIIHFFLYVKRKIFAAKINEKEWGAPGTPPPTQTDATRLKGQSHVFRTIQQLSNILQIL